MESAKEKEMATVIEDMKFPRLAPQVSEAIVIKPPNFKRIVLRIKGTAPYVQHRFHAKAEMMKTQEEGSQAKSKKKREPKDFEALYIKAMHTSPEGWHGIPASCFRNAMISACRTVGYKMTHAKLAVFVEADGMDQDTQPIIKILKGTPRRVEHHARNDNGSVDIRSRPMWDTWETDVRLRFDADMFSATDVTNLMQRVGMQVGIGEGRPDSKNSAGMGWGTFEIAQEIQ